MEIENHILTGIRQQHSPNYSDRPAGEAISLLVIHNISLPPGKYGGSYIDDLFCNRLDCSHHPYFEGLKELRVSAHLLINRAGQLTQYVPFNLCAHHAGISSFMERDRCNEFSIGIEMEGCDEEIFADAQYQTLSRVTRLLMKSYPGITEDRIVGHSDIAPGRKTDPGPCFDWQYFRDLIAC